MTPPRAPEWETVRIGEAARRTGLTPRTLRYDEELGLLGPHSAEDAASRRYGPAEIDRLARIRELQDLLGLSLEEIRVPMERDDATEDPRARFHGDSAPASQRRVVAETMELNRRLLGRLDERIARIERFRGEIEAKLKRQAARAAEPAAAEEAGTGPG